MHNLVFHSIYSNDQLYPHILSPTTYDVYYMSQPELKVMTLVG